MAWLAETTDVLRICRTKQLHGGALTSRGRNCATNNLTLTLASGLLLEAFESYRIFNIMIAFEAFAGLYSQWNLLIGAGGVQGVDPAVAVVVAAAVQLFAQFHRHLPVSQRHVLPVPDVHFTAKVKHQDLQDSGLLAMYYESAGPESNNTTATVVDGTSLELSSVTLGMEAQASS